MSVVKGSIPDHPDQEFQFASDITPGEPPQQRSAYRYLLLACLFLTFTYNIIDRYLVVFLYSAPVDKLPPDEKKYQSMKEELGITSTQYGFLTGPCFMAVFALVGFFSGWAADNLNRKYTMLLGLVFSVTSAIGVGFATHFWHLLLLRGLLAAGQAFFAPLGYAIISQYYSISSRVTANGVFASGVYAGYGLATLSLILIAHVGWRNCAKYFGYAGGAIVLLFAVGVYEKKEKPSPAALNDASVNALSSTDVGKSQDELPADERGGLSSWFHSFKNTIKSSHLQVLILAATFRLGGGSILGVYLPLLMKERFPEQRDLFAILNSVTVTVAGILSSYIGGRIADWWIKKKTQDAAQANDSLALDDPEAPLIAENPPQVHLSPYFFISALSCLLSLPLFSLVFFAQNLYMAMGSLFAAYLVSECYFSPLLATVQSSPTIPKTSKGMGIALLLGFSQCLGSLFTVAVGYIDDEVNSKQWELVGGVVGCNAVAGMVLLAAAIWIKS